MRIEMNVQIWREGSLFVAHAMPIDVMSAGETPEAARQALDEAVRTFVNAAAEAGTLTEVLEECGYVVLNGTVYSAPSFVSFERHSLPLAV